MAINKVIDRNGNTLIDLTNDTIKPNKVLEGVEFHGPDGNTYMGQLPANEIDALKYTFYDYDGELLYSYTDEELDALDILPVGADHTEDNLTFQGWNWTLEDLKAWDRTRPDRPIVGAHYITTDGVTYITLTTDPSTSNLTEMIMFGKYESSGTTPLIRINWGDGAEEEVSINSNSKPISHTYPAANTKYTIQIIPTENADNLAFGAGSSGSGRYEGVSVESIKIGTIRSISKYNKLKYSNVTKINIPSNTNIFNVEYASKIRFITVSRSSNLGGTNGGCFSECKRLETVSLAPDITIIYQNTFAYCRRLRNIVFPDNITELGSSSFRDCYSLEKITLPNNLTTIKSNCFNYCYGLLKIDIPNSVTSIGMDAFNHADSLVNITLSKNLSKLESNTFSSAGIDYILIPDSVQSIGTNCFYNIYQFTLDLSEQTKVISLTGAILASSSTRMKVLVPSALLDEYKSASYWSNYASRMVGV